MNKIKTVLAFGLALFVMVGGMTCSFNYFFTHSSMYTPLYLIGSAVVLFPSFDFWFEAVKGIMKGKNENNQ